MERLREKLMSVKKNTLFAESTFNDKWGRGCLKLEQKRQKFLAGLVILLVKWHKKRKKNDQWRQPKQSSRQQKSTVQHRKT